MSEAKPFPKTQQLARGERRYRRKVASPKQWQAIIAAKGDLCRLPTCEGHSPIEYHHVVPRDLGGDDVVDNIVPLCHNHHLYLTARERIVLTLLAESLTMQKIEARDA